jgi:chemotaxis protein methyltransferase CheR
VEPNIAEEFELNETEKIVFDEIREWLNERCGMYYPDKKQELLLNRLLRVCKNYYFNNLSELLAQLYDDDSVEIHGAVVSAASTNHTYFFREPQSLDYYRDVILPTLKDGDNRIWSAAASSGDEAYTIAMITAQQRGLAWTKQNLTILGTDISEPVIAKAEKGIYKNAHLEHVPQHIFDNYFESMDANQYRVHADIRRLCTFRRMNLKNYPYPFQGQFDIVFCRNVLYYFEEETQSQIVENLYNVTKSGGWLLTCVTGSLRYLKTSWIPVANGIYRKY